MLSYYFLILVCIPYYSKTDFDLFTSKLESKLDLISDIKVDLLMSGSNF